MKSFFDDLKSDRPLTQRFCRHMYEVDPKIVELMEDFIAEVDELVANGVYEFTQSEGYELSRDEIVHNFREISRNITSQMDGKFTEQFNNVLMTLGKPAEAPLTNRD